MRTMRPSDHFVWPLIICALAIECRSARADDQPWRLACADRQPGELVHNPIGCATFWICPEAADQPFDGRCPSGYNFNPAKAQCDLPQDFACSDEVAATTQRPTEAPAATDEPTTAATAEPPAENVCAGRPNGVFINNPIDCQAYWICHNGIGFDQSCPPEYNFNEAAQVCDKNYPCSDDPQPAPEECPSDGVALLSVPDSCTRYRFCFGGQETVRECRAGLHFDAVNARCDYPDRVDCQRPLCPTANDPLIALSSRSACDEFYLCYDGQPLPFRCAAGLHWNANERYCDFPQNANCPLNLIDGTSTSATTATTPPATEPTNAVTIDATTLTPHPVSCPSESNQELHIIAHPSDCSRYFICSLGEPVEQHCPGDLKYDPAIGMCNKPERVTCVDTDSHEFRDA